MIDYGSRISGIPRLAQLTLVASVVRYTLAYSNSKPTRHQHQSSNMQRKAPGSNLSTLPPLHSSDTSPLPQRAPNINLLLPLRHNLLPLPPLLLLLPLQITRQTLLLPKRPHLPLRQLRFVNLPFARHAHLLAILHIRCGAHRFAFVGAGAAVAERGGRGLVGVGGGDGDVVWLAGFRAGGGAGGG